MKKPGQLRLSISIKLLTLKVRYRLRFIRLRRCMHLLKEHITAFDFIPLQHALKLCALSCSIVVVLALVPAPFAASKEDIPFYGDFAWQTDAPVRLSAGDFRENGRGGIEDYVPRLRLIEYTIEKGDTIWNIARKYDVDPDSIISCNVFTNVHAIHE